MVVFKLAVANKEYRIVPKRDKERKVLISLPHTRTDAIYLRLGDAGPGDVYWQSNYAGGFLWLPVPANTAVYAWATADNLYIGVLDQR